MMLLGHKAKSRLFMCLCENCSTITKLQIREKKTIKITKLSKYNEGYNKNSQQTIITPCGKFKWREQIRRTLQFKISTSALKCANKACLNLFTSGLMAIVQNGVRRRATPYRTTLQGVFPLASEFS
jgi:hypothetical protein